MPTATAQTGATTFLQGIEVPAESVNPTLFFALTRRKQTQEKSAAFAGLGFTDTIELRKSDILSEIRVRMSGSVVVTLGGGTAATTARWPNDLLRVAKFTANGASNLINMGGLQLKAREAIGTPNTSDRGIAQSVIGATVNQGTLASASELWGIGTGATAISAGTYTYELTWLIPVAEDQATLAGAVFLATTSTDLTLSLQWAQSSDLFVLTGAATAVVAGTYQIITKKFSVPVQNGNIVVPELNLFHSCVSFRTTVIANGLNEVRLPGQGIGKSLLRAVFNVYNGSTPTPLVMSATNFADMYWRYGNNETPDDYPDGRALRQELEHLYDSDVGGVWGFGAMEFAAENGFRDAVDEGTTSDLRIGATIQAGVSLTTPFMEGFAETIWLAGEAA
jgi:hypothetical protein